MSQINFDALASEHPEFKRAWRELEAWMNRHREARVINPRDVAREARDIEPVTLATALTLLVSVGLLRRVYKVTTPSGVLADGEFDDPTKIPPKLPDRFQHYFDTAESDIVPVFRWNA
jgi:hypothetical protein